MRQVKDQESGEWLTTAERKRLAAGWVRQDLTWIPPNEAHRVDQGLWKVDGAWVDLASADRRRSRLGSQWTIPGARVRLHATCDRAVALGAREHMELALEDMRKVLGADPPLPLDVALYRIEEQFDRFAFGEPDGRRPPAHVGREHTIHNGFFAESWFPGGAFAGMGVGLWDSDYPHGDAYGVHSARFALGLSYVDALDPSPKATRRGPSATHLDTFEEEKSLPRWLRWGAAVYAERYYEDSTVPPGGDPWWTRRWSLENLGTPGPLAETLAFEVDPDERERAQALLLEAGLVVSFMVDGDCEPVRMAHATLKQDLVERRLRRKTLTTLVEVLLANEDALRAFAELE